MNRKVIVSVAVMTAFVFSLLAPMAFAYDHGKDKKGNKDFGEEIFTKAHFILENQEELEISDEQAKKIKDLKIKAKKDMIRIKADIDVIALDIKQETWKDVINIKAVNSLIDKKYDLKKAKAKSSVAACAELKSILTEEQKKALKALKKTKKCKKDKKKKDK